VHRHPQSRFWFESAGSSVGTVLLGMTLVWPSWIESVFGADPDSGSGLLECLIVVVALIVLVCALVLARREWRRATTSRAHVVESAGQGSGQA
jgi:hypothetical protein